MKVSKDLKDDIKSKRLKALEQKLVDFEISFEIAKALNDENLIAEYKTHMEKTKTAYAAVENYNTED